MPTPNDTTDRLLTEEDEFKRWVSSTTTALRSIGQSDIEVCSISIVPEHLRRSNKDAYSPKVVSIGPLHRKTKRELLYTKEAKWRCMLCLLHRTRTDEQTLEALDRCMKAMNELDYAVLASYVDDDLKLVGRYDMAKIMLLDGCFLLDLLISHNTDLNDRELKCRLKQKFGSIKRKEELLSDLILLENQIPLLVLTKLYKAIFFATDNQNAEIQGAENQNAEIQGAENQNKENQETIEISELVLSLFGCFSDSSQTSNGFKSFHLLGLLHSFMTRGLEPEVVGASSSFRCSLTIPTVTEDRNYCYHEIVELKRCATKLHAAGVKIVPRKKKGLAIRYNEVGFNFGIKFNEEKKALKIPKLHITKTTEAKWRNFIAWEHNRCDRTQITPLLQSEVTVNCKFSWYALFIQGLICCEHDIQLLKDKGIILVNDDANSGINQEKEGEKKKKKKSKKKKGMSNKELMIMLNNIADGIDRDKILMDFSFGKLFKKLNDYRSTRNCFIETVLLFWHWLRCFFSTSIWYNCERLYGILKTEYTPHMWKKIGIGYALILLGVSTAQLVLEFIKK